MVDRILKNSALTITLLTAFLYLAGVAYNIGYINEFGATAEIFSLSFHDSILIGFTTFAAIFSKYQWYLASITIVFLLLGVYLLSLDVKQIEINDKSNSINKKIDDSKVAERTVTITNPLKKWINSVDLIITNLVYYTLFFIFIISISAGILKLGENVGIERANVIKNDFKNHINGNDGRNIIIVEFVLEGNIMKGIVVSHSNDFTLIYTQKFETLILNNSVIEYLRPIDK